MNQVFDWILKIVNKSIKQGQKEYTSDDIVLK